METLNMLLKEYQITAIEYHRLAYKLECAVQALNDLNIRIREHKNENK